jgi:hypothetical protein
MPIISRVIEATFSCWASSRPSSRPAIRECVRNRSPGPCRRESLSAHRSFASAGRGTKENAAPCFRRVRSTPRRRILSPGMIRQNAQRTFLRRIDNRHDIVGLLARPDLQLSSVALLGNGRRANRSGLEFRRRIARQGRGEARPGRRRNRDLATAPRAASMFGLPSSTPFAFAAESADFVRAEIKARSFSASAAYKCKTRLSTSGPNSATTNGTRCAIKPEMKWTSLDKRSSLATVTGHRKDRAFASAAANCGRRSKASNRSSLTSGSAQTNRAALVLASRRNARRWSGSRKKGI